MDGMDAVWDAWFVTEFCLGKRENPRDQPEITGPITDFKNSCKERDCVLLALAHSHKLARVAPLP